MESDMTTKAAHEGGDRIYHGLRDDDGNCHVVVMVASAVVGRTLSLRLDLANKSPSGFEWGYGGSGPAQLALALCADALGDDEAAVSAFQRFKWAFVAKLDRAAPWTITAGEVRHFCRELEAKRSAGRDDP
jgi:hypothetical protein